MRDDSVQPSYNEAARYAFKQIYPEGFLRFLVPEAFLKWKFGGWVDSQVVSFPGDPERRCDTVAEFTRIDGDRLPVALVVEFETVPNSDMYPREGEYCLRLRREVPFQPKPGVPYDVVGAIVFLTGPKQPTLWRMQPDDFCGLGLVMEAAVPCFRDLDVMAVLAQIEKGELSPALLVFTPLMGGADKLEAAVGCRELIKREDNERKRRDLAALVQVMANLNEAVAIWRAAFQEMDMDTQVSPFLVEYINKGLDKGRSEGAAAMRRVLRRTLEQRAGGSMPEDVRLRIETEENLPTLEKWCGDGLNSSTWDEVRKMMDLPAGS